MSEFVLGGPESDVSWYNNVVPFGIPLPIMPRAELSWNDKAVFARLIFYGGPRGLAYAYQSTLGEDLGLRRQVVNACLKRLEAVGLIRFRGRRKRANIYSFPAHPWMLPSVRKPDTSERGSVRKADSSSVDAVEGASKCPKSGQDPVRKADKILSEKRTQRYQVEDTKSTYPPSSPQRGDAHTRDDGGSLKDCLVGLWSPHRPGEVEWQDLAELVQEHGEEAVRYWLIEAKERGIPRRNLLGYASRCLRNAARGGGEDYSNVCW